MHMGNMTTVVIKAAFAYKSEAHETTNILLGNWILWLPWLLSIAFNHDYFFLRLCRCIRLQVINDIVIMCSTHLQYLATDI